MEGPHPRLTESQIQALTLGWLKTKGFFVWRQNNGGVWDASREAYRNANGLKGVSDILGVLPDGRFLAIEVKSSKGKTSKDQDAFLASVNAHGGLAFVVRDLEDVKKHLEVYLNGHGRSS